MAGKKEACSRSELRHGFQAAGNSYCSRVRGSLLGKKKGDSSFQVSPLYSQVLGCSGMGQKQKPFRGCDESNSNLMTLTTV
jgi:hypothetical protein